jgi:23S rRNA (uridine2552-2'-O)-methyltransferase
MSRGRRGKGRGSGNGGGETRPGSGRGQKTRLRSAKGRSVSSTRWLERQLGDPYVAEARRRGYRSRAAFKLAQIDDKFGILRRGARVVDLGAAPGGWSQVARERCGDSARIVALDLEEIEPLPGVVMLQGDFGDPAVQARVRAALQGPADVVLSDMAAPATGHAQTDHLRIMRLVEEAYVFAAEVLAPGGAFVAKVLQGGTEAALLDTLKRAFAKVRHVKPPASRADSAELYLVATGFRGETTA